MMRASAMPKPCDRPREHRPRIMPTAPNEMTVPRQRISHLLMQPVTTAATACLHATLCLPALPAFAATPYPSKPVRLVIPFPPGGSTDFVGRIMAQKLSESLGQQVIADNRGAGAAIGTTIVARAIPDGYTLLLGSSSGLVTNPLMNPKLPYDPFKDFDPIIRLNRNAQALAATPALPANNVKELIALAKARPGKLNIASKILKSVVRIEWSNRISLSPRPNLFCEIRGFLI